MDIDARILVMDDEPLVRLMVCSRLEELGAWVCEAGSCAEAIELARNTAFDAAIFDYRLPDGNGLDVVHLLRKEGIEFQVVMLSGESSDIDPDTVSDCGVVAVLPKPPDVDAMVDAVVRAAGGKTCAESEHVGRYEYWKLESSNPSFFKESREETDWLALDVSALGAGVEPSPAVLEWLQKPRCGLAIIGADSPLRGRLDARGIKAEFVADKEELAALSRRPSSLAERDFLLESIIQRN